MPIAKGSKRVYFPKVKEAREALAQKALDLFEGYLKLIQEAQAAQKFEVAAKGYEFLMSHMPKDDDGVTMIDSNIDKGPSSGTGEGGLTVQIGIALATPKVKGALPPSSHDEGDVIDAEKIE